MASSGLWTPLDDLDMIDLGVRRAGRAAELLPAARAAAEDLPRYLGGAGYHPTGIIELREAVAAAYTARGLPTAADQIMVTSGTQHALDLVLRLARAAGRAACWSSRRPTPTRSPRWPPAGPGSATHGLDADAGWDADLLLGSLRQTRPRLAYLIPEFQNPTGHLMPAELRERLVAAAHARRHRPGRRRVLRGPAAGRHARCRRRSPCSTGTRRVVSIGGMSKPYWGGLRIGWVRASAPLVQRLAAARVGVDMASPVLDQLVAVHLLADADAIVAGPPRRSWPPSATRCSPRWREQLPEWRFTVPRGGVTLWAELDGPISSALARAAEEVGVRLAPGPRFGLDGTLERFLRLPFTLPADDLTEAVGRIAAVRYDLDRAGRPRWREPAVIA